MIGFSHVEIAIDVLDFDRRVIHQHADGERETAEGHDVDGVAAQVQSNDGGEDGQRDRRANYDDAAPASQKCQNHQRDQDRRKHGLAHNAHNGGTDEYRLIEVDFQLHALGRGSLDDRQGVARCFHHR